MLFKTRLGWTDSCTVHECSHVLKDLCKNQVEVEFILPAYTERLQDLDIGINKPFKNAVNQEFERFLLENPENTKIQRHHMARWFSTAWSKTNVEEILNTWRSIGIEKNGLRLPDINLNSN